jgi:hypothetical protein
MARVKKLTHPTDNEIRKVHRRYVELMETERLELISEETKNGYLIVMRTLTEKLAVPGKPLSEIIRETMAEAAPIIFQVMQH